MDMRQGIALIAFAGVASATLGWVTGTAVSADDGPVAAPTTTAAPLGDAEGERDTGGARDTDPLRITLAGDSVMAGLAPALEAAIGGDTADVEFVLTPSILRDATVRFTWSESLEDFDPDVVVMFVGTWELGEVTNQIGTSVGPQDPAWRATYEHDILDPWIDLVTSGGAEVLWLGAPAVPAPEVNALFGALNEAYRGLESRNDAVRYLDSSTALGGDVGVFQPTVTTEDGATVRVRQVDGLHLCPDGARLLAEAVIDALAEEHQLEVAPGWQRGSWRNHKEYPPEDCPPA
jgi:hypothetical protein